MDASQEGDPALVTEPGPALADRPLQARLTGAILGAALLIGLLANLCLRDVPWGVGFTAFVVGGLLLTAAIARWLRVPLVGGGRWLAAPMIGCAVAVAVHDSMSLLAANLVVLVFLLGLGAARAMEDRIVRASSAGYLASAVLTGSLTVTGPLLLLIQGGPWNGFTPPRSLRFAPRIALGLALAVPLVWLFGGLLSRSDPIFAAELGRILRLDFTWLNDAVDDFLVIGIAAWFATGALGTVFRDRRVEKGITVPSGRLLLGIVEIGVVLGLLDVLFLGFVLVQLRYFFGGAPLIEASVDLTYAEYARSGFFELVWVTVLALPVLLTADWVLRRSGRLDQTIFRILACLLVALLAVVIISALRRMGLYVDEFGLTELRLYTTAIMIWIALLFGWFVVCLFLRERQRFALGALCAGLAVLACLNVVSPDALIARSNLTRKTDRPVDVRYLNRLSADAAPALAEALPSLSEDEKQKVAAHLLEAWSTPKTSWQSWNLSRMRARQLVTEQRPSLEKLRADG
jgi:hypothetical protein